MKQRWIGLALSVALLAACEAGRGSVETPMTPPPEQAEADAPKPAPTPAELGVFADVRGWITYGNDEGIWAANPTPGARRSDPIQLSDRPGDPVAWSSDGSKLLILRFHSRGSPSFSNSFLVLNADGTETQLARSDYWISGGTFAPDGSKFVYSATLPGEKWRSGIYVVDADGGSRRLLLAAGERTYPDGTYETAVFQPSFSPDGTQIAYFDGLGDWGNGLWVMDADGSGVRAIVDCRVNEACPPQHEYQFSHVENLAWSSDGSHLSFNGTGGGIWIVSGGSGLTSIQGRAARWSPTGSRLVFQSDGISVMDADGSGLRQVAPFGRDPVWSPDGSRIAYLEQSSHQDRSSLYVVDLDGTPVSTLSTLDIPPHARVLWNPLAPSTSRVEQPTATASRR